MERFSQYSAVILSLLIIFFIFISHWLACVWFVIGQYQDGGDDVGWLEQLAILYKLPHKSSISQVDAYVTAMYFTASSLTTIGFGNVAGNTREEKIFSIVIMFIGALMHATIFGNVASIVGRMYARRAEYDKKVLDLEHFAKVHKLPKDIKHRMEDHLQTKWFFNRGLNTKIPSEYPPDLQGEISYHLNKEVLDLPLFEGLPKNLLKYLGKGIETQFAGPNEFLITKDDPLHEVWYISSGSMEVMDGDMVVAILGRGDLVGSDLEHQLNNPHHSISVRSGYDVKALTYCELKSIEIESLTEVTMRFPEMADYLAASIRNDLTFNLKAENCFMIHNRLKAPSYVVEKEVQTTKSEEVTNESEIREYILSHKSEVLAILGVSENVLNPNNLCPAHPVSPSGSTNSVKFKFDNDLLCFSPTNSYVGNVNNRTGNPRKILKKQNSIISKSADNERYLDLDMPRQKAMAYRSHSLGEANGEISPGSKRRIFLQKGKQKSTEMTTLQKFQARFSSMKSTSIDECQSPKIQLTIPEIILNVPEDDYKQEGSRERKFEDGFIQKSPLIAADIDEVIMGRDNHVLSISLEKL